MNWVVLVLGPTQSDCAVVGPFATGTAACDACQTLVDAGMDAKVHHLWTAQQAMRWNEVGIL